METLIEAHNLNKSFGATQAVRGLNLKVKAGEICGLMGPDGAGKTTTIRLLCGILKPSAGEVLIQGVSMTKNPDMQRSTIGYLAQRFSLYEDLTVLENIRFFAEVRGIPANEWRARSMEILRFIGLEEFANRLARQLSGGMKQKLGLATALIHRPLVLLLDEPTTGVDPVTRQDFWQLLIRLVGQEGISVLVATPYMDEAARCMHLGFMQNGSLMLEGTPSELTTHLSGRVLELKGEPLRTLRVIAFQDEAVQDVQMFGNQIHLLVRAGEADAVISRLNKKVPANGGLLVSCRKVAPILEDVFLTTIREKGEQMEGQD
jgi:ABC-2 type transport system ATP-binding protein